MDSNTAYLLGQSDEILFAEGGCHIFASCLHDIFGYPLRLLRDVRATRPSGVVHVYCLAQQDVMVDFFGCRNERVYLRSGCYGPDSYLVGTVEPHELEAFRVKSFPGGGLYSEPLFVKRARTRALKVINAFPERFRHPPPPPAAEIPSSWTNTPHGA